MRLFHLIILLVNRLCTADAIFSCGYVLQPFIEHSLFFPPIKQKDHPSERLKGLPSGSWESPYRNLVSRFETVWQPSQHISIIEGVIAFCGRVNFWCCMPDKPHKYGMKSFMVGHSSNGYCANTLACRLKLWDTCSSSP